MHNYKKEENERGYFGDHPVYIITCIHFIFIWHYSGVGIANDHSLPLYTHPSYVCVYVCVCVRERINSVIIWPQSWNTVLINSLALRGTGIAANYTAHRQRANSAAGHVVGISYTVRCFEVLSEIRESRKSVKV